MKFYTKMRLFDYFFVLYEIASVNFPNSSITRNHNNKKNEEYCGGESIKPIKTLKAYLI